MLIKSSLYDFYNLLKIHRNICGKSIVFASLLDKTVKNLPQWNLASDQCSIESTMVRKKKMLEGDARKIYQYKILTW